MMYTTSVYNKIRVVLDYAGRQLGEDGRELEDVIHELQLDVFMVRKWDAEQDRFVVEVSRRSIIRCVRIATLIGLLSDDGSPTKRGTQARTDTKYAGAVEEGVREYLSGAGFSFEDANSWLSECLHRYPPELPTAATLFDRWQPNCSRSVFAALLTLLSNAGGCVSTTGRVFGRLG